MYSSVLEFIYLFTLLQFHERNRETSFLSSFFLSLSLSLSLPSGFRVSKDFATKTLRKSSASKETRERGHGEDAEMSRRIEEIDGGRGTDAAGDCRWNRPKNPRRSRRIARWCARRRWNCWQSRSRFTIAARIGVYSRVGRMGLARRFMGAGL